MFFSLSDHVMVPQKTVSFKCRLMHVHPNACARIINEENKRQIPWRTPRGLIWENKTYQLKKFISPGHYRSQDGELAADKQGALSVWVKQSIHTESLFPKYWNYYYILTYFFNYSSFTLPNVLWAKFFSAEITYERFLFRENFAMDVF